MLFLARLAIMVVIANLLSPIYQIYQTYMGFEKTIRQLDHYQTILHESCLLQNLAFSLASSLSTSLHLLPSSPTFSKPFSSKQMQAIQQRMQAINSRMRQSISRQATILTQVNEYVSKISVQFRQFIDLAKEQAHRTNRNQTALRAQLACHENKIQDCQTMIENATLEQEFKDKHYATQSTNYEPDHSRYLQTLKDIKQDIEAEIELQNKHTKGTYAQIAKELKQHKTNLLSGWHTLSQSQCSIQGSPENLKKQADPEKYEKYNQWVQREYVKKEAVVENFEPQRFEGVKKMLDLHEGRLSQSFNSGQNEDMDEDYYALKLSSCLLKVSKSD